jgi:hypothetical protein
MRPKHAHHFVHGRIVAVFAVLVLLAGGRTWAKCGSGPSPDYDDITAVMFQQDGCGGTLHPPRSDWMHVSTFECSTFYAVVWTDQGPKGPISLLKDYVQYDLRGATGTYHLGLDISRVRSLLLEDSFFSISPPDMMVTDTAKSVISVKRCAVVTRIALYNQPSLEEPAAAKLFRDFRTLIKNAPKTLVSRKPAKFLETGLFDP